MYSLCLIQYLLIASTWWMLIESSTNSLTAVMCHNLVLHDHVILSPGPQTSRDFHEQQLSQVCEDMWSTACQDCHTPANIKLCFIVTAETFLSRWEKSSFPLPQFDALKVLKSSPWAHTHIHTHIESKHYPYSIRDLQDCNLTTWRLNHNSKHKRSFHNKFFKRFHSCQQRY